MVGDDNWFVIGDIFTTYFGLLSGSIVLNPLRRDIFANGIPGMVGAKVVVRIVEYDFDSIAYKVATVLAAALTRDEPKLVQILADQLGE